MQEVRGVRKRFALLDKVERPLIFYDVIFIIKEIFPLYLHKKGKG